MHLPDGVLPASVWFPCAAVASASVTAASVRVRREDSGQRLARAGFLGAAVLVAQAVNFPLLAGASAHLTGTSLIVCVAGLELGLLAMASVLLVQSLLFQDGGVLALGSNFLDMVLVPALLTELVLRAFTASIAHEPARVRSALPWSAALAAWIGMTASGALTAVQLATGSVVPIGKGLPWLVGCQSLVGLVEAALTYAVVHALVARRASLLAHRTQPSHAPRTRVSRRAWTWVLAAVATAALVLIPIASRRPDVLESLLHHAAPTR